MKKRRIMFVCHGNICRSPMAEFIFKDMLKKKGILAEFTVASTATSSEEIYGGVGNPVYPPARAELARHGIRCDGKRAIRLQSSDYEKYDLFVGMDSANISNMHIILGGDPDGKIHKLMDFTPEGGEVSDPWYTRRFDKAYEDIDRGCLGLLEYIKENGLLEV